VVETFAAALGSHQPEGTTMGYLYYGNAAYTVEIDDRPLAHLKVAILSLLRSGHSVAFSFVRPVHSGSGRETLWIAPTTDIRFRFNGSRGPRISELWVRQIIATANTPAGLHLIDEPSTADERSLVVI
jgi:hypothetical protein